MSETTFNPAVIEMQGATITALHDGSPVLADVNWTVQPGESWVVAGQQHSGKSDLLMHAAGLMTPAQGSCRVFGCETANFGEAQIAERLRVGFVFADGKLFNQLNVAENVALPLRYQKNLTADESARAVELILELFELGPYANVTPANLRFGCRHARRSSVVTTMVMGRPPKNSCPAASCSRNFSSHSRCRAPSPPSGLSSSSSSGLSTSARASAARCRQFAARFAGVMPAYGASSNNSRMSSTARADSSAVRFFW